MKIETNVPLPVSDQCGAGRPPTYPFGEMNVGDSIVVPTRSGVTAAHIYGKKHDKKFRSRQTLLSGYRIWRIE